MAKTLPFLGNFQLLRRKIRENWKDLRITFRHEADKAGDLDPEQLRYVLQRYDIVFADAQFSALVKALDEDGDGKVSFQEFMAYFGKGQEADKNLIAQVRGVSVGKAKQLLQDKLQGRLEGGPAALRRAFQFFDRDGGGTISAEEFEEAMAHQCSLQFEPQIQKQLFALCSDGARNASCHRLSLWKVRRSKA